MGARDTLKLIRRLGKAALGRDVWHLPDVRVPVEHHGSRYGGWSLFTGGVSEDSVVYSVGVGEDASFDLSLIRRFGVTVHAFDPTPKALGWVAAQELPSSFRFHPLGIADYDGAATFNAPTNPDFASYSIQPEHGDASRSVKAEVRRLSTLMGLLGHDHVDVLKMDIEGAEYTVLLDILSTGIDVRQVLVEFHHAFDAIGLEMTNDAVALLRRHNYALVHVSPAGQEYSFVRKDCLHG